MTPTFRFRAVVFDLDGTLINSHAAMMRCYEQWATEWGVDLSSIGSMLGQPSMTVARALVTDGDPVAAGARIEELEVEMTGGVVALPGSLDALTTLPPDRVAIGTSCTMALFRARLGAAGLPCPDIVVTVDQVASGKPAPDTFLTACERLGINPADVLVCEDAPAGIAAARAAGCQVLGITTTKSVEELPADAHASDLAGVAWAQDGDDWTATVRS